MIDGIFKKINELGELNNNDRQQSLVKIKKDLGGFNAANLIKLIRKSIRENSKNCIDFLWEEVVCKNNVISSYWFESFCVASSHYGNLKLLEKVLMEGEKDKKINMPKCIVDCMREGLIVGQDKAVGYLIDCVRLGEIAPAVKAVENEVLESEDVGCGRGGQDNMDDNKSNPDFKINNIFNMTKINHDLLIEFLGAIDESQKPTDKNYYENYVLKGLKDVMANENHNEKYLQNLFIHRTVKKILKGKALNFLFDNVCVKTSKNSIALDIMADKMSREIKKEVEMGMENESETALKLSNTIYVHDFKSDCFIKHVNNFLMSPEVFFQKILHLDPKMKLQSSIHSLNHQLQYIDMSRAEKIIGDNWRVIGEKTSTTLKSYKKNYPVLCNMIERQSLKTGIGNDSLSKKIGTVRKI